LEALLDGSRTPLRVLVGHEPDDSEGEALADAGQS
jgi:hypothetical protein